MALEDLTIATYRALTDLRFEGMGRACLIVGGNNSGKSSILEAAGLVLRPFDPGQWVNTATNRDSTGHLVSNLWSIFPQSSILRLEDESQVSDALKLRAIIDGAARDLSATASASLEWDVDGEPERVLSIMARVMEPGAIPHEHMMAFDSRGRAASNVGVRPHRVYTVTPATHRSTRPLVAQLSLAIDQGKKALALDLLQLFDPLVEDVDVSYAYGRDGIRVTHKVRGIVDLSSFGDGMRRSAAIALALTNAEGGVVLIDEIEGGIHFRAIRDVTTRILNAAARARVQIIATTHSLEAIDAVLEAVEAAGIEDMVGYHVRRDDTRHYVRRYDRKKLTTLRDGGLDLR